MRREKSFRGINENLARTYLENLGGETRDDGDVSGDGWRASLSSETVSIGPSVELTEVTVVFEGDEETLDSLVERFSQKAMRAGG
ncbi:hypothetical protein [Haladaptatus salinisoli]|uniref:hypothetical protein n=1 Tax=Haladaptatus salinisoli TaxID=2884876 RepID=UPI001D0BCAC5|nr:hypothetical protein [Haladaptatus salinisoli]